MGKQQQQQDTHSGTGHDERFNGPPRFGAQPNDDENDSDDYDDGGRLFPSVVTWTIIMPQ